MRKNIRRWSAGVDTVESILLQSVWQARQTAVKIEINAVINTHTHQLSNVMLRALGQLLSFTK